MAVADGAGTSVAARQVGVSRPTVIKWRDRFAADGLAGLEDEARTGRLKKIDDAAIMFTSLYFPASIALVEPTISRITMHQSFGTGR